MIGFFIFLIFIVAIFFAWFFMHKSKEEERRLLIEQGTDISDVPERRSFNFSFPWLKIGILITFIAVGGLLGGILEFFILEIPEYYKGFILIFSLFIFGGIGMITAHYVDKPNNKT